MYSLVDTGATVMQMVLDISLVMRRDEEMLMKEQTNRAEGFDLTLDCSMIADHWHVQRVT